MNNSVPQSKGCSIVNMPFRLITAIDILEAMRTDQLGISRDEYKYILEASRCFKIIIPPVMDNVKPSVAVSLNKIKKTLTTNRIVAKGIIPDLEQFDNYRFQEELLVSIKQISSYETVYDYLMSLPEETRQALQIQSIPGGINDRMCVDANVRETLKKELLGFVTAKKTKRLGSIVELKEILLALAIFDNDNQDILEALRASNEKPVLFENACAELLFRRLGIVVRSILPVDTKLIVKRLSSKITKMPLTAQQQIAIKSIFRDIPINAKALVAALNKTRDTINELEIEGFIKEQLIDYVTNLINIVIRASFVYVDLFFTTRRLRKIRLIYISNQIELDSVSYREQVLNKYCNSDILTLYPTKDYGDLLKHFTSRDCSNTICEQHMKHSCRHVGTKENEN